MYRLGHRIPHHYRLMIVGLGVAAVLVGTSVILARVVLQPHTMIKQSSPVTHTVLADETAMQHIVEHGFSFDLPQNWKAVTPPSIPYTVYSWSGTVGSDASRRLDVYIGGAPPGFAVNRLLPVDAAGDHMTIGGAVSDNCVNFTDPAGTVPASGTAPSKWGGINFLCDMGNYERNVVAIGSMDGLNTVRLTGPTVGTKSILLIYTDHSASPIYTIFTAAVNSFHLL